MRIKLKLLLAVFLFLGACRKSQIEKNGLPTATQEGKNTMGFLLNSQAWTPNGYNGTANLSLYYDQYLYGGYSI